MNLPGKARTCPCCLHGREVVPRQKESGSGLLGDVLRSDVGQESFVLRPQSADDVDDDDEGSMSLEAQSWFGEAK